MTKLKRRNVQFKSLLETWGEKHRSLRNDMLTAKVTLLWWLGCYRRHWPVCYKSDTMPAKKKWRSPNLILWVNSWVTWFSRRKLTPPDRQYRLLQQIGEIHKHTNETSFMMAVADPTDDGACAAWWQEYWRRISLWPGAPAGVCRGYVLHLLAIVKAETSVTTWTSSPPSKTDSDDRGTRWHKRLVDCHNRERQIHSIHIDEGLFRHNRTVSPKKHRSRGFQKHFN